MNIIIDSTEYKKDRGLNKANISLIKDMGKEGLLKLHIPYFVYKECTSSSIENLKIELNGIKSTLNSFNRKGMGFTDFSTSEDISKQIEKLIDNIENSNIELWDEFILEAKAILYKFDEKDSIKVFEAYFSGGKPFKSLKNRDDIPDAFIFETIKKISEKEKIYLLSGDNNLREKCSELKNVIVSSSFQELFDNSEFKTLETKYKSIKETQKVEDAKQILLDNRDAFEDAVNEYARKVNYLEVYNTEYPSDNGLVNVYAIDEPKLTIDEMNIKFIDDKFFVPIEVKGIASVDYAVFKADYWAEDDLPSVSEDLNRHYYLIEDVVTIVLKKTVSIEISDLNEDEVLDIHIEDFDEITVEK